METKCSDCYIYFDHHFLADSKNPIYFMFCFHRFNFRPFTLKEAWTVKLLPLCNVSHFKHLKGFPAFRIPSDEEFQLFCPSLPANTFQHVQHMCNTFSIRDRTAGRPVQNQKPLLCQPCLCSMWFHLVLLKNTWKSLEKMWS